MPSKPPGAEDGPLRGFIVVQVTSENHAGLLIPFPPLYLNNHSDGEVLTLTSPLQSAISLSCGHLKLYLFIIINMASGIRYQLCENIHLHAQIHRDSRWFLQLMCLDMLSDIIQFKEYMQFCIIYLLLCSLKC